MPLLLRARRTSQPACSHSPLAKASFVRFSAEVHQRLSVSRSLPNLFPDPCLLVRNPNRAISEVIKVTTRPTRGSTSFVATAARAKPPARMSTNETTTIRSVPCCWAESSPNLRSLRPTAKPRTPAQTMKAKIIITNQNMMIRRERSD